MKYIVKVFRKLRDLWSYLVVYSIMIGLGIVVLFLILLILVTSGKLFGYCIPMIMYIIVIFIFKIGNRVKVEGYKNIPRGEVNLFFFNHQTLIDSFPIVYGTVSFWDMLFHQNRIPINIPEFSNFYRNKILRILFWALKTRPISRETVSQGKIEKDADTLSKILTEEKLSLILFFAGTREGSGKKQNCKIGPILTVLKARPKYFIPGRLVNIEPIMPPKYGSKINLRINMGKRGKVIFGKPVSLEQFYDEPYSWESAMRKKDAIAALIEKSVAELK